MPLLPPAEWRVAEAIAGIGYCNPFLPERVALERRALGRRHVPVGPVIWARPGARVEELFPNYLALHSRAEALMEMLRARLAAGAPAAPAELLVYEDLALYLLDSRYLGHFEGLVIRERNAVPFWPAFQADFDHFFRLPGRDLPSGHKAETVFAGLFQIERAFIHIFQHIVGGSMPAARLRAAVWQSAFTHDMRRYARTLHGRMADVPTLVVGPSGSGKELVARAVGLSGFIPFDPKARKFAAGAAALYVPLNLAALAPMLIESELFGHVKGAFTTAHADRDGWLQRCGPHGAVFLDEIGELDGAIQVKLLRVLETRQFQRVGSTETIPFRGKIIAATNRDLAAEMRAGRFRHDLYYRLCADQVATPSLAEQLADRPDDLPELVRFIVRGILLDRPDDEQEDGEDQVGPLTNEVVAWIDGKLGRAYPWPGNFRELGQCVRNVMVRGTYRPVAVARGDAGAGGGPVDELLRDIRAVALTKDELLGRYCALAYHRTGGSYLAAGRLLGVDPRVVRQRLSAAYLERLREGNEW